MEGFALRPGARGRARRVARAHLMARGRVDKALRRLELDHVLGRAAPVAGDLELGKPAQGWRGFVGEMARGLGAFGSEGIAIRTVNDAQLGEKQTDEMMNFCDGGDSAFATTARDALLDADRGR